MQPPIFCKENEILSTELKFTIDVLVKWFYDIFKSRLNELDEINKQLFTRNNPIDWSHETCVICGFKLATGIRHDHNHDNLTTGYDFTVTKEHIFLRNIYSSQELKQSKNIKDLEYYYRAFDYFLHGTLLLDKSYNKNSEIEFFDHGNMARFLDETLDLQYFSFLELYETINNFEIKTTVFSSNNYHNKNYIKLLALYIQT